MSKFRGVEVIEILFSGALASWEWSLHNLSEDVLINRSAGRGMVVSVSPGKAFIVVRASLWAVQPH